MICNSTNFNRDIIAFTHIKKAAGTTFTHMLRNNFFLKHCDVVPLSSKSSGVFQTGDMLKLFKLNPFVRSIAGHSVMPYGDLLYRYKNIKFITILRDPIKRYISQYQHNVETQGYQCSFDTYLNDSGSFNKQTRTIAGSENLEKAKNVLKNHFYLVGTVENFDEFLIILRQKLLPDKFYIDYKKHNVAIKQSPVRINVENNLSAYRQKIIERNKLDIELYSYVKNSLFAEQKIKYKNILQINHDPYTVNKITIGHIIRRNIDFLLRKIYYKPAFYIIRKNNSLSIREAV